MVSRLWNNTASTEDVLRAFAEDLNDSTGDVVASQLILAASGMVALLAGVIKGMVGFAMPMIMISLLGIFLPPDVALAGLILPTLLGAAVLVFFLLRAIPGDVCEVRLAGSGLYVDEAEIQLCREKLGLANPLIVQFWDFITGYVVWDLGDSMWTGKPVTEEIGLRF